MILHDIAWYKRGQVSKIQNFLLVNWVIIAVTPGRNVVAKHGNILQASTYNLALILEKYKHSTPITVNFETNYGQRSILWMCLCVRASFLAY